MTYVVMFGILILFLFIFFNPDFEAGKRDYGFYEVLSEDGAQQPLQRGLP